MKPWTRSAYAARNRWPARRATQLRRLFNDEGPDGSIRSAQSDICTGSSGVGAALGAAIAAQPHLSTTGRPAPARRSLFCFGRHAAPYLDERCRVIPASWPSTSIENVGGATHGIAELKGELEHCTHIAARSAIGRVCTSGIIASPQPANARAP
jgi:hypothetical protein